MAKLTYLQLVNRVLKRITQSEVATVTGITGHGKIIAELINEAQTELWTETTNWYSLFKMRTFSTATYTASTIAFNNANPDTITDTANGLGLFQAGQTIVVSGSTSNNGVYVVNTAVAGTLTLQTADSLTAEIAGDSVTIYAVTYPVASDWGRTHHLVDMTNDRVLVEDMTRAFSEVDPNMDSTNNPTHFSLQGDFYRLFYVPNGAYKILDRYWKLPTALSTDTDTSDLPLFCENFLIYYALMKINDYLNKFDAAERLRVELYGDPFKKKAGILEKAMTANKKILDRMLRFQPVKNATSMEAPRFPSSYGVY